MEIATAALCGDLLIAAAGFLLLCLCLTTVLSFFSFYCYSIRSSYKRIKQVRGCAELSTKVSAPAQKDMVGQIIANMLKMVVSPYYFGTERRLGFGIKKLHLSKESPCLVVRQYTFFVEEK